MIGAIAVVSPLSLFPRAWVEAPTSVPAPGDSAVNGAGARHVAAAPVDRRSQVAVDPLRRQRFEHGYVGITATWKNYSTRPPRARNNSSFRCSRRSISPTISIGCTTSWIAEGPIQRGDKVLVIGTGSAADSWAVSLKTQSKVYAVDINPLAVLNARVTAKLGGFDLEIVAGDFQEIELPETFRDFDYVLWNMPFVEAGGQR